MASPARPGRRGSLLPALLALSLVLLGVGALVLSASSGREPARLAAAGADAPVNLSARDPDDISAHNSPTLARNPRATRELAVSSRIDTPFFSCALHVSADAGATWTQTPVPAPPGEEAKCFAPDVAFGADGTLYYSFVTLRGIGNVPNALWLATSRDGGRTLSDPVRVAGELAFQVRLATDPVRPRRVYLTWLQGEGVGNLRFDAPGNPIVAARSDDGGATWSAPVRLSDPARGRVVAPAPAVARDGTLLVAYLDLGDDRLDYEGGHGGRGGPPYDGTYALVLARSRDGGMRWEQSVAGEGLRPVSRFVVFLAPAPSLAVAADGRVHVAFHDARLGDADVWLWTLPPDGRTWEPPRRVNDTPRRDGRAQYLPRLAVAPDGRLDVLYYDRRADPQDVLNSVSFQSSFDHGRTFTAAIRLSSRSSDSRIGFGAKEGMPDLGSRLGLVSDDRAAFGVWTDTRAGTAATQKQDLAATAIAISPPRGLSSGVVAVLRYGGLAAMLFGAALLMTPARSRMARTAGAPGA